MKMTNYDCINCGDITTSTRFCHWCMDELSIDEKIACIDIYKIKKEKKKEEVKKLRNCDVCAARKARNQKIRQGMWSVVKAGFSSSFHLVVSIGAIYYLIQEGVIL